jgi:hypothetical protein
MINFKKEKLIKKHLGIATPDWIVQNCIKMLNEFEDVALTIPVVVKSLSQDNYCNVCNLPTDGEKCYSKRCPV